MYDDLIGIPFLENGEDVYGVDCYNLMRLAYKLNGKDVPKTNISVCACKQASNRGIEEGILKDWEPIDKPEVICGVLILSSDPRFANHIATYVGDNRILHITLNTNSIIERMYPKYKNKIVGFYRFIG